MSIFGVVLLWASAMGLSFAKVEDESSTNETFNDFILGGLVSFLRNLSAAISDGFGDRSSSAFPLLILFGVAIGLVVAGGILLIVAAP